MKSLKSLFLKIINISTLLTLTPRSSLPKKKIFIFLHVAKSGGSSFWNSLVDSINSSSLTFDIQEEQWGYLYENGVYGIIGQNGDAVVGKILSVNENL